MANKRTWDIKDVTDKLNSISPSMCGAKWAQSTIYLNTGHTHSCHHPGVHSIPLEGLAENPGQLHNTPFKMQARQQMLDGVRPSECDYCWRIEDLGKGHLSDRTYKSASGWAFPEIDNMVASGQGASYHPKYLEVLFESTCNFACTYCMPEVSSKWWAEIEQHGPYKLASGELRSIEHQRATNKIVIAKADNNPYIDAFWKIIPEWWPSLQTFRITGGEPLLSKHTWKMIDFVEKNANMELGFAINTNLGVPDQLIDKMLVRLNEIQPNLREVSVFTSVEATGAAAEYIRYGMDYTKYISNLQRVLDETTATVTMMTTINALCYSTFVDFLNTIFAMRNRLPDPSRFRLSLNYLRHPEFLDIRYLPDVIKQEWTKELSRVLMISKSSSKHLNSQEFNELQRLVSYMNAPQDSATVELQQRDLVLYTTEQDKRRGLDFPGTFERLVALLPKI